MENIPKLTFRENQILLMLKHGKLYKEVADDCGIHIDTVKKHCFNIYKKLNVRNKTEAINIIYIDDEYG
jgi:two-component system, NarL family, response regulator LiaR